MALGYYYYWGHRDYERAVEAYSVARAGNGPAARLEAVLGYVLTRQGRVGDANEHLAAALDVSPNRTFDLNYMGFNFLRVREYPEAIRYFDKALSIEPDFVDPYRGKAEAFVRLDSNTQRAWRLIEEAREKTGSPMVETRLALALLDRDYERALAVLSGSESIRDAQNSWIPRALLFALVYRLMHEDMLAREYFDSSLTVIETKIRDAPEDDRVRASLGKAYAGLGRVAEAIRAGEMAVRLMPLEMDVTAGVYRVRDLAEVYVMVGEHDLGIDQLDMLLGMPCWFMSTELLRLDPMWDPLRDHPGFQALLDRHRNQISRR
jgi:serine/threonine-protein kinase